MKKTYTIEFMLTLDQKNEIESAAELEGLSRAAYCRFTILKAARHAKARRIGLVSRPVLATPILDPEKEFKLQLERLENELTKPSTTLSAID